MADNYYEQVLAQLKSQIAATQVQISNAAKSWNLAHARTLTNLSPQYATDGNGNPQWTVPANTEWQFQSCFFSFTTAATAGNRNIKAAINNGLGIYVMVNPSRVDQPASVQYTYLIGLYPSLDSVVSSSYAYIPTPPIVLEPGDIFQIILSNKQAGDYVNALPALKVMERSL